MLSALVMMVSLLGSPAPNVEAAQPERAVPPGISAQKEAMKKLEWLAGEWEGPAKYDSGRGGENAWVSIRQTEAVKMKMGGRVLLVEGVGFNKDPSGVERQVFEALAMVSYDPETKEYQMRAFGPEGAVDPKVEVGEQSLVWSFPTRTGKMRYTVRLDAQSRWSEVGERSTDDGNTWVKFVDMVLEKKK